LPSLAGVRVDKAAEMSPPQIRVAGILVSDGAILLESLADREVWGLPGGGLEPAETLEEGCRREFREELGLEVRCEELAVVMENHFHAEGQAHFELGFYFRVTPATPRPSIHSREPQLQFRWFPLQELAHISFVPPSLAERLPDLQPGSTLFLSATP
jgi:ADP-ribose pyrophosphatase YjhB (NUDIX family)